MRSADDAEKWLTVNIHFTSTVPFPFTRSTRRESQLFCLFPVFRRFFFFFLFLTDSVVRRSIGSGAPTNRLVDWLANKPIYPDLHHLITAKASQSLKFLFFGVIGQHVRRFHSIQVPFVPIFKIMENEPMNEMTTFLFLIFRQFYFSNPTKISSTMEEQTAHHQNKQQKGEPSLLTFIPPLTAVANRSVDLSNQIKSNRTVTPRQKMGVSAVN